MRDFQAVTTYKELDALVEELENGPDLIAFDVETGYTSAETVDKRSLNTRHPDFVVVGFSITNNSAWSRYIPLRHDTEQPLEPKIVWEKFRNIFETKTIIAHNASFERAAVTSLYRAGDVEKPLEIKNVGHDTMIIANLLGKFQNGVGLKALTKEVLGEDQTEFATLFGDSVKDKSGKIVAAKVKKVRFNSLPVTPEVVDYGCDDTALCMELFNVLYPQLTEQLKRVYMVEMQILVLMAQAEEYGVGVDWAGIQKAYAQYQSFRPKFETKVREEFAAMTVDPELKELARTANFGSAVQMRKLLYNGLGMKTTRTTNSGEMSTDAKALEALSRKHPAVRSLLSLREIDNMGRRLKKWLAEYSDCFDKRVHPSFNQVRVASGRFAASDPAIQQLPKDWFWHVDDENAEGVNGETYWSGNFRKFIVAGENKTLCTFDYSQQELRVLAGITGEPTFVKAFAKNEDPHKATASMLFNKPVRDVTKEDRQTGKAQPLTSKVLTPTGWRLMGDLRVGDFVVGSDGQPTRVTGVFPQGKKRVFEVVTSDGAVVECCEEHLWQVVDRNSGKTRVLSLAEILSVGIRKPAGAIRFGLPQRAIIQSWEDEVEKQPIDPYVLGLLLGDGSFKRHNVEFCSNDVALIEAVEKECLRLDCISRRKTVGSFTRLMIYGDGSSKQGSNRLLEGLRFLNLVGRGSATKFIPDSYLFASADTRLSILQGLLDTDGSKAHTGAKFKTTSPFLADGVVALVRSLGGFSKKQEVKKVSSWAKLPQEVVQVSLPKEMQPFKLDRKKVEVRKLPIYSQISAVRKTKTFKEMQCISVEAEDSLYITDGFVLTHNTINFALLYGMGARAMSEQLAITKEEAQELIDTYKARLSKVGMWDSVSRSMGVNNKYVTTWFGRVVPLWDAYSDDPYKRSGAERLAVNAQIQGGAADYTKLAMIRAWSMLKAKGMWGFDKVMLTMNQHDSLTFEFPNELDPNEIRDILQEAVVFEARKMFPKMQIPVFPRFDVDWEMGKTWGGSVAWPLDKSAHKTNTGWEIDETTEDHLEVAEWEKQDETASVEVQTVMLAPGVLHVVWTGKQSQNKIAAFNELVKNNPGDSAVYLTMGGKSAKMGVTTNLTKADASQISMTLGGAEVFERTEEEMKELL